MAGATIAPSLPQLKEAFIDVPNIDLLVKLVLTVPGICIAVGAPAAGIIVDRFGRIKLLTVCTALYGIAGASGFFMNDIYLLLAGRVFLGLAVGGIMTVSTTLVGDYFTGTARNAFLGFQASFMAVGGVVYIVLGGFVAEISWRAPFLIYASALLFLPLILGYLYEPDVKQQAQQPAGAPKGSTNRLGPILGIVGVYVLALFFMLFFYMMPVQIPFYIQELGVTQNFVAGLSVGTVMFMGAVVGFQFRHIRRRLQPVSIFGLCFLLMGIGYVIMGNTTSYWVLLLGLVLSGMGAGLALPNSSLWLIDIAPVHIRGRATGGLTSAIFTGQFLSPVLAQPLIVATSLGGSFYYAGLTLTAAALLVLILGAVIYRKEGR